MTEKIKPKSTASPFSSFHLEADRCSAGMRIFVTGIVGIGDYSEEKLEIKSHSGRMWIEGKRLKICIFENNSAEIQGRIENMRFFYGKG